MSWNKRFKPNAYEKELYKQRLNKIAQLIATHPNIFSGVVFSQKHPYTSCYFSIDGQNYRISTHHKDKYNNSFANTDYEENTSDIKIVTNSFDNMIKHLCKIKKIKYTDDLKLDNVKLTM